MHVHVFHRSRRNVEENLTTEWSSAKGQKEEDSLVFTSAARWNEKPHSVMDQLLLQVGLECVGRLILQHIQVWWHSAAPMENPIKIY